MAKKPLTISYTVNPAPKRKKVRRNKPTPELFSAGRYVEVSKPELQRHRDWANEAVGMITKAYAPLGGHANLKTVEDIYADDSDVYRFEDLDADDEADVLQIYKTTSFGRKSIASGHDGTKEARRRVVGGKVEDFRQIGNYGEVSDRLAALLLAAGVPVIGDQRVVRKVLAGKKIEWLGTNPDFPGTYGWYERSIGGHKHKKILVGRPNVVSNPKRRKRK